MLPFVPQPGKTVNIDVAATSANVLVSADTAPSQVRIANNGTQTVWIKSGTDNTVAATLTDSMPIFAGEIEVLTFNGGPVYVAAIAAAASGKVYFTPGMGF